MILLAFNATGFSASWCQKESCSNSEILADYNIPKKWFCLNIGYPKIWWFMIMLYHLTKVPSGKLTYTAIENGHRTSEFSHWTWWFAIVMLVYRKYQLFGTPFSDLKKYPAKLHQTAWLLQRCGLASSQPMEGIQIGLTLKLGKLYLFTNLN